MFDWDGTVRKIDGPVAQTYIDPYVAELAKNIGMDRSELAQRMQQARQVVIARPEDHGWDIDGARVTAATDTYLMTQAEAKKVLAEAEIEPKKGLLSEIHKHSRSVMALAWQPGVAEFMEKLKRNGGVAIVTNTETQDVEEELKELMGSRPGIEVKGNAKKFVVDEDWDGWRDKMPYSSIQPENYPHPVPLKRPYYFEVLEGLGEIKLVLGDLSELDLLVPQAMGIKTALKRTDYTPHWELSYYGKQGNGKRFLIEDYRTADPLLTIIP